MKSTITYTVLIAITCALFVSCHQEKPTKEASHVKEAIKDTTTVSWTPCKNLEEYGHHIIPPEEAEKSLELYKDYIDSVKNCLDSKDSTPCKLLGDYNIEEVLNYGSSVDFDLLLQVLGKRKLNCNHKLYLMNGIRPKRDDENNIIEGELVTEIIFVHESDTIIDPKKNTPEKLYTYFDFTQPCPNGCPEAIPGIAYPKG